MPLYLYQVVNKDGTEGEVFEVLQSMKEDALTVHPETGEKVKRIFGTPNAPRTWTDSQGKTKTSDMNLERIGFTKYVKNDQGKYQKLFGSGPETMKKPPQQE
ncbi:hypothetical protein BH11PLA2_BH11PLA2_22860 [soil metagenome]